MMANMPAVTQAMGKEFTSRSSIQHITSQSISVWSVWKKRPVNTVSLTQIHQPPWLLKRETTKATIPLSINPRNLITDKAP